MKKIKILVLGLIAMFVSINVNALEVDTWEELETCLAGSETTCTVTDSLSLTTGSKTLALNGTTVVLEKTIEVSGTATLTINGTGNVNGSVSTGLINVKKGGTLTVNGGSFRNEAASAKCFGIYGSETDDSVKTILTIAEGVKLSANYGVVVGYASTTSQASYGVEVNYAGDYEGLTENGTYKDGTIGISTNGYIKKTTGNVPVINITGGSIKTKEGTTGNLNKDDAPAIYAAGYAKWNISGGVIEGSEALSIKAGEFEVTGGTLKAFGVYADPASPYNDGSEATGAAISITANDGYAKGVKITVKDATVESENGYAVYEGLTTASQTTALADGGLKLEGGSYTAEKGAVNVNNAEGFITGGTYSSEVDEEYLSTDLVTKEDEDGNYLVGEEHNVTVATTENGEVEVDKEKAVAGEKVTITITPSEGYEVDAITVNAGNENVNVANGKFVMPDGDVEVSVTFKAIENGPNGDIDNPQTGDNIMLYVVLCLTSLAGLVVVIKKRSFN